MLPGLLVPDARVEVLLSHWLMRWFERHTTRNTVYLPHNKEVNAHPHDGTIKGKTFHQNTTFNRCGVRKDSASDHKTSLNQQANRLCANYPSSTRYPLLSGPAEDPAYRLFFTTGHPHDPRTTRAASSIILFDGSFSFASIRSSSRRAAFSPISAAGCTTAVNGGSR